MNVGSNSNGKYEQLYKARATKNNKKSELKVNRRNQRHNAFNAGRANVSVLSNDSMSSTVVSGRTMSQDKPAMKANDVKKESLAVRLQEWKNKKERMKLIQEKHKPKPFLVGKIHYNFLGGVPPPVFNFGPNSKPLKSEGENKKCTSAIPKAKLLEREQNISQKNAPHSKTRILRSRIVNLPNTPVNNERVTRKRTNITNYRTLTSNTVKTKAPVPVTKAANKDLPKPQTGLVQRKKTEKSKNGSAIPEKTKNIVSTTSSTLPESEIQQEIQIPLSGSSKITPHSDSKLPVPLSLSKSLRKSSAKKPIEDKVNTEFDMSNMNYGSPAPLEGLNKSPIKRSAKKPIEDKTITEAGTSTENAVVNVPLEDYSRLLRKSSTKKPLQTEAKNETTDKNYASPAPLEGLNKSRRRSSTKQPLQDKAKNENDTPMETMEENTNNGDHFKNLLNSTIKRFENICEKWDEEIKNDVENKIPEDAKEALDSATGYAKLIVREKLAQFGSLIVDFENKTVPPVTIEDLQGFWDMVYIQVLNIDKKFVDIEALKNNNWETVVVSNIKKPKVIKKTIVTKKPAVKSSFREFLNAKKRGEQPVMPKRRSSIKTIESPKRNSLTPARRVSNVLAVFSASRIAKSVGRKSLSDSPSLTKDANNLPKTPTTKKRTSVKPRSILRSAGIKSSAKKSVIFSEFVHDSTMVASPKSAKLNPAKLSLHSEDEDENLLEYKKSLLKPPTPHPKNKNKLLSTESSVFYSCDSSVILQDSKYDELGTPEINLLESNSSFNVTKRVSRRSAKLDVEKSEEGIAIAGANLVESISSFSVKKRGSRRSANLDDDKSEEGIAGANLLGLNSPLNVKTQVRRRSSRDIRSEEFATGVNLLDFNTPTNDKQVRRRSSKISSRSEDLTTGIYLLDLDSPTNDKRVRRRPSKLVSETTATSLSNALSSTSEDNSSKENIVPVTPANDPDEYPIGAIYVDTPIINVRRSTRLSSKMNTPGTSQNILDTSDLICLDSPAAFK